MAMYHSKSKWNSQRIKKQCNNKHHNNFDDDWSLYSNSNHWRSFVNDCNQYQKNVYTNYNNEDESYFPEYQAKYWRCNKCTFDNKECDLYCSICKSPFKSISNQTYYNNYNNNITLNDYIPSYLNDIINIEDDMDESIQIALISSYQSIDKIFDYDDVDDDVDDNLGDYNTLKLQKKPLTRKQIAKRLRKEREERRRRLEEEKRKLYQKWMKNPELKQYISDQDAMTKKIKNSLSTCYGSHMLKNVDISHILNKDLLFRFISSQKSICNLNIVYHGTNCKNEQSIIRNGLITGGTKGVRKANGDAYGKGVYCSPVTSVARSYERGSMFICIVKENKVNRNGNIWVIPNDNDILPIYLASFMDSSYRENLAVPTALPSQSSTPSTSQPTLNAVASPEKISDFKSGEIIKFCPTFTLLNIKNTFNRKIQRKWSAYHKINGYGDQRNK